MASEHETIGVMQQQRRNHTAVFKDKVAVETLKGTETVNQIAVKYVVYPVFR